MTASLYSFYNVAMFDILPSVKKALDILKEAGFDGYIVGGCVRDLLAGRAPKDWDITTNAKPEDIERVFGKAGYKTFYENAFGTVTALVDEAATESRAYRGIEITPFRREGKYSNKRHPDEITWAKTLEEDLARRDFTINAMALAPEARELKIKNPPFGQNLGSRSARTKNLKLKTKIGLVDLFGGQEDLKAKIVRAVGAPEERFREDALRLMRACRIATELGFAIEEKTLEAIRGCAHLINDIASERARDELEKIIVAPDPKRGILLLKETGLLRHILPELLAGEGVSQRGPHRFDIFTHNLLSLKWAAKESESLAVRLAALFHDIGKTTTRVVHQDGKITFYDHPAVGARVTEDMLTRLHFPRKVIDEVCHLVYHHMFYYDVGKVTPSGVRRLLTRVGGADVFRNLLTLRHADRSATPVPKMHPYRLRHLEYMMEKVASDPLARSQLVINGNDIKETLGIPEGIRVGLMIQALLAEVLEDPQKNTKEYLLSRARAMAQISDEEAKKRGGGVEEKKKERDNMLKTKYYVK